ncbi:MAG: TolC family protein [Calditrichaeota bacterium]|nr:TolC family protein [Calditrichota bacterium]
MKTVTIITGFLFALLITLPIFGQSATEADRGQKSETDNTDTLDVSLDDCIDMALKNNHFRPAAQYAVKIAETQRKQALSAYWPQLAANSVYTVMDEAPNFLFPASTMAVPPIKILGFDLNLPPVDVPEQDIKLMNRKNWLSTLNLTYPLYTGGLIKSYNKQANSAVEIARQEARRTDLKIIYDVKRFYYAAVLARNVRQIGEEALARLQATLDLTEGLYKKGSGRVKKTDYLKNKIIVGNVRALVAKLKNNEKLAKAALINTMGLDWRTCLNVSTKDIPFDPYPTDVEEFINGTYQYNPKWAKLKAALKIFDAKIGEAKSGYFPKVAIMGTLSHIENAYDKGMVSSQNKDMWTVGIGIQVPLFAGFRTRNQVKEARLRLDKLQEQKILLREGLALQVQYVFMQMASAQEQQKALKDALDDAEENRILTERAYQFELVDEKNLIESQIIESLMKAQYQKILYDHIKTQAHLDYVVGEKVAGTFFKDRIK